MPVYEFSCPNCGTRFDLRRSISRRNSHAPCPECFAPNSTRRVSLPLAFAQAGNGAMRMVAGGDSGCGSCSASSCAGCGS